MLRPQQNIQIRRHNAHIIADVIENIGFKAHFQSFIVLHKEYFFLDIKKEILRIFFS